MLGKVGLHKLHQRYILWYILRMYLWWSLCTLHLHACQVRVCRRLRFLLLYLRYLFRALISSLVWLRSLLLYLSYLFRALINSFVWLRSLLLYLSYLFRALINFLVCWFSTKALGFILFQIHGRTILSNNYSISAGHPWSNRTAFQYPQNPIWHSSQSDRQHYSCSLLNIQNTFSLTLIEGS